MKYRIDAKSQNELSALGFGCMRFARNPVQIDYVKAEKLVLDAIACGVNYFDTAYYYMGSEEILGRIIEKNDIREKMFLATKLPFGLCKSYGDFDKYFKIQLDRLKTSYIDYYLIHNLTDLAGWEKLRSLGIERWIEEKRHTGEIYQIGFSFHGAYSEYVAVLDAYDWDFCQIQYNYYDENFQAGKAGLKKAAEKGMPVIVMEPLLGGKLATGLPKDAVKIFKESNSKATPAQWAIKWLLNQPEVTVVLSGMSSGRDLAENLSVTETTQPDSLTGEEMRCFDRVRQSISKSYKIPCTGCNYCMPCPHNVNIPGCFASYNMYYSMGRLAGFQSYITGTAAVNPSKNFLASNCAACGKCEKQCPQNVQIIKSLKQVKAKLEPFWMKSALSLFRKIR